LVVLLIAALHGSSVIAQGDPREYQAKARFLANAPEFVAWPPSAFRGSDAPLAVCVYGDFSFGTTLAELTRASTVQGHRMEVRWVKKDAELAECQVLFVSHSNGRKYQKVLDLARNSFALTVGEDQEFLKAGGMLSVETVGAGLLFDVNLDAVRGQGLRLSSQLLALARRVIQRPEAARS
jgi:hypothetical protein